MKELVRKELRENFKLAVLGLVIFTVMALQAYRNCTGLADSLRQGPSWIVQQSQNEGLQPLVSRTFLIETTFFCAMFGAVLGWIQIYHERHRDLWAFLIHRPMTRTQILLGKALAGIGLYLGVTCLPWLGLVGLVQIPGRVAAPFEWGMLLPGLASVLAGIVCYLGGLLTGLRQARWFGSRTFGLGLAIITAMAAAGLPEFWQALLAFLIGGAVLAAAVWGSFQSDGFYLGQPLLGKLALTGALTVGSAILLAVTLSLLGTLLPLQSGPATYVYSRYVMTRDGTIFKQVQHRNGFEIEELNGMPARSPETGEKLDMQEFYVRSAREGGTAVEFGDQPLFLKTRFQESYHYFALCSASSDTLWYYWARLGRFVAYDAVTRRFVGSLGPKGYAPGLRAQGDHFDGRPDIRRYAGVSRPRIFTAGDTAWLVDLESRTSKLLFTTTREDPIGGTAEISAMSSADGPQHLVVTRRYVHLLSPDGKVIWKRPYEPGAPDYTAILLFALAPPGQYALWIGPSAMVNQKAGWKLPEYVTWVGADGTDLKRAQLPALPGPEYHGLSWEDKLMSVLSPPVVSVLTRHQSRGVMPWAFVFLNFAIAILCAVVCGWWSQRFRLGLRAQSGWVLFSLLSGLVGFLAFLCVQEWPAREPCPRCKKPRLVDRERCENCNGDFPAPERTGAEIFELASSSEDGSSQSSH